MESATAGRLLSRYPYPYPFAQEQRLKEAVLAGNAAGARQALEVFLRALRACHPQDEEAWRSGLLQLVVVLGRKCHQAGVPVGSVLGTVSEWGARLAGATAEEQHEMVAAVVQELVEVVSGQRAGEGRRAVQKAREYVRNNYHKPLTLEEVAAAVHLSPCYLSRLFTRESGRTFQEYLTSVRISAAKELLRDRRLSLQQVAGRVGYADVSYFIRVFKKLEGTTPRRYHAHGQGGAKGGMPGKD